MAPNLQGSHPEVRMLTTLRDPYIAESLGTVMRRGFENETKTGTSAHADAFAAALEDASAAVAGPTGPRQNSAASAQSRHEAAAPVAPELDRLPPIPADRTGRRFTAFDDPTPRVQAELAKMGMDPSQIRFERWDDDINTIGGNHTNHLLRAFLPNGRVEDYSIEWTLRSPQVTANDIWRLMGMPAPRQYV
ncbi:MAG: hypothetical protein R2762_18715 [Bryobacteraceae bacterium]